jgi:hypothetical protein
VQHGHDEDRQSECEADPEASGDVAPFGVF